MSGFNYSEDSFELFVIYSAKWKLRWVKSEHMVTPDPYKPPLKVTLTEIGSNTKYLLGLKSKSQPTLRSTGCKGDNWTLYSILTCHLYNTNNFTDDLRTVTYHLYMTTFRSRLLKALRSDAPPSLLALRALFKNHKYFGCYNCSP